MDAPSLVPNRLQDRGGNTPLTDVGSISDLIEQATGFARRQLPIFVFILACSLVLGLVYLFTAPSRYTAHAMLLIDSSRLRVLQQQQGPVGDIPLDTAQVETQVEILKSENIGLAVVKESRLTEDPEFTKASGGILGFVFNLFASAEAQSDEELTRNALRTFLRGRSISRVGRTYVLDIGFTSLSPSRANGIANAIADAYIVDQLEAKYQATRRAGAWLQDRIKELRTQASNADRAVLDYKEQNKIVDVGGGSAVGGMRLLGEQQLGELNTQLGTARAATVDAKARLERITEVMKRDVPDAAVADSLRNEVITKLRSQYLELSNREAIWSARYGADHLATVNLRTQMHEIRRSIGNELGRIAESYKSDYEIAKARQEDVEKSLAALVIDSQSTNRDRLGLRDLESTAQVYHTIYDNFLQRYMEAIQQQSFPITEARVISTAAKPSQKSSPVALAVLAIAGALGMILSLGVALIRDATDGVFRTTRQVETFLGFNCISVLPLLRTTALQKSVARSSAVSETESRGDRGQNAVAREPQMHRAVQNGSTNSLLQSVQGDARRQGSGAGLGISGNLASVRSSNVRGLSSAATDRPVNGLVLGSGTREFMRWVVEEPLSAFAEGFRSVKMAADIAGSIRNNRVIGVTSTLPGEGKSTVSSNLAQLIAHAGKKVILLDGDLRNPTLTRSLSPNARLGLIDVLAGNVRLQDVLHFDGETRLAFLPAVLESRLAHTSEILASEAFKSLIDDLKKEYEYVIIDLSPLAPVVDVRATAATVDSYLYVVEWGKTRINLVQRQLESAPELAERLLGVVLNKANVKALERYEGHDGKYYNQKYYGSYGYTS
jgi:succinoglycan biosynthesis transport protein ExoP